VIGAAIAALYVKSKAQALALAAQKEADARQDQIRVEAKKEADELRTELRILSACNARLESEASAAEALSLQIVSKEEQLEALRDSLTKTKSALATATTRVDEVIKAKDDALIAKEAAVKEQLEEKGRSLQAQLVEKQKSIDEQRELLKEAESKLAETFEALSGKALQGASDQFIKLAESKFATTKEEADGALKLRQQAIENLIKPVSESLGKLETQVREMETKRVSAYDAVNDQIERLMKETGTLSNALRRPTARGSWGEITLRNVADQAGLIEGQDYVIQHSTEAEDGKLRADMVVRLPNGRSIVIDSKTPLDSYKEAVNTEEDISKQAHLANHAKLVRGHIKALGSKNYQSQYEGADYVVMFLPAESIYQAAMEFDATLLEEAGRNRVILVNPMTLIGLLKAVSYVLDQERLNQNAIEVSNIGRKLYDGITSYAGHIHDLGKHLKRSVETYNKSVGSLERSVLSRARVLKSKGIGGDSIVPEIASIDVHPESFKSAELCNVTGEPDSLQVAALEGGED
jgi:DNA recombination protein RmuC